MSHSSVNPQQSAPKKKKTRTRIKRRASDAKWRANIAHCYDSLKRVIPLPVTYSKKKIPKALVLKESCGHIKFLEETLSHLLTAVGRQVTAVAEEDINPSVSLQTLRDEFIRNQMFRKLNRSKQEISSCNKHFAYFDESNYASKCDVEVDTMIQAAPSIFHDWSLEGLFDHPELKSELQSDLDNKVKQRIQQVTHALKNYQPNFHRLVDGGCDSLTQPPIRRAPKYDFLPTVNSDGRLSNLETPRKLTRNASILSEEFVGPTNTSTPNNSKQKENKFVHVLTHSPGFTPIHQPLKSGSETESANELTPATEKSRTFANLETIDNVDKPIEFSVLQHRTPRRKDTNSNRNVRRRLALNQDSTQHVRGKKERPRCRVKLESLYDEDINLPKNSSKIDRTLKSKTTVEMKGRVKPVNTLSSGFVSGFSVFRKQVLEQLGEYLPAEKVHSASMSDTILQIWKQLPDDQKNAMVAMAMMNELNKSLSEDLKDIKLDPMSSVDDRSISHHAHELDLHVFNAISDLITEGNVPKLGDAVQTAAEYPETEDNDPPQTVECTLPSFDLNVNEDVFDDKQLENLLSVTSFNLDEIVDWDIVSEVTTTDPSTVNPSSVNLSTVNPSNVNPSTVNPSSVNPPRFPCVAQMSNESTEE